MHARIDRGAARTLILYNMYDVMPAVEEGWTVPPFRGGVVDLPGLGACFVGRGAENNKGPLAGMLVALRALLATGALDANVEVLVEGEEETGSGALRAYLGGRTPVRRAAAALFPSFCEYGGGAPRVYLGFKGIVQGRVRVTGAAMGAARGTVHGSNGPWIGNPVWRLVEALAALAQPPTGHLRHAAMPADAEPVLRRLAARFDPAAELAFRDAAGFAREGSPEGLLRHVLTACALNLSDIASVPPGGRGVIPRAAEARFELRLPPGLSPEAMLALLRRRIALFAGAAIEVGDGYPAHRFPATAPGVAALLAAYRGLGADPVVWPWAIGAAPAYAFAGVADSFLIGGLGRGGNAHGIDEFVTLAGLDRFIASLLAWLPAIAKEAP